VTPTVVAVIVVAETSSVASLPMPAPAVRSIVDAVRSAVASSPDSSMPAAELEAGETTEYDVPSF